MAKDRTPLHGGATQAQETSDQRVYSLASELFVRKVAAGACLSKTADSIALACLEEARAFVAVADARPQ